MVYTVTCMSCVVSRGLMQLQGELQVPSVAELASMCHAHETDSPTAKHALSMAMGPM